MTRPILPALLLTLLGCSHKPAHYDAEVEVERIEIVRRDPEGKPLAVDVTVEFAQCPGQQTETFRGGTEFGACVAKLKKGDKVPVKIVHEPDEWGIWDLEVLEIAGCPRKPEPKGAQTDHSLVQVCRDIVSNGNKIGFRCDQKPSKELLLKCPWFRTR